jgi:hypothetical protein
MTDLANLHSSAVDVDQLPGAFRELIRVVGWPHALKIVEHFSGLKLYIPTTATPQHEVAALVGLAPLQALCREYRCDFICVPKMDKLLMQLKHKMLHDMVASNIDNREIAKTLNYTLRRVEQLKAAVNDGQHATPRHPDFFDSPNP